MEESEEDWGDGEEDDLPVPVPDARQPQGQQGHEEEDGVEGREGTHLGGSGLGLCHFILQSSVARWHNLIPSIPWIAPEWRAWGRNPGQGWDQILQHSVAEP